MVKTLILATMRFCYSCRFPHRPSSSFLFFDWYVPFGGLHNSTLLHESKGRSMMENKNSNLLTGEVDHSSKDLTLAQKNGLFHWLGEEIAPFGNRVLKVFLCPDPIGMRLFARDCDTGTDVALSVHGLQSSDELERLTANIRRKLTELVSAPNFRFQSP